MNPLYVVDTETTGLDGYPYDLVVEIGIAKVDLENGTVLDVMDSVVGYDVDSWPAYMRSAWIFQNTTLTPEEVSKAPRMNTIVELTRNILSRKHVTSYNRAFDFSKFLLHPPWSLKECTIREPCLMVAADAVKEIPRSCYYEDRLAWPRLENAYEYLCPDNPEGIIEQDHRALSDARMAGWVAIELYRRGLYRMEVPA